MRVKFQYICKIFFSVSFFSSQAMSVRSSLVVSEEAQSSPKKQQRSKSEVRRPAFYFPGEIPKKTNAYTCL